MGIHNDPGSAQLYDYPEFAPSVTPAQESAALVELAPGFSSLSTEGSEGLSSEPLPVVQAAILQDFASVLPQP